jgi:hypothetical protein
MSAERGPNGSRPDETFLSERRADGKPKGEYDRRRKSESSKESTTAGTHETP